MPTVTEYIADASLPVFYFSKTGCSYCNRLNSDLTELQIPFRVIQLEPADYETLFAITKSRTFPQLFINHQYVGGYTDFSNLCMTNSIATLLAPVGITPVMNF